MTKSDFLSLLETAPYDFLRENEHLHGRIMFLTLAGSHSYGLNRPDSDVDLRGCVGAAKGDLLGLTEFQNFRSEEMDTTIYAFPHLFNRLLHCNPNCIGLLGSHHEHYAWVSPAGQMVLDNRKFFLSQRAYDTFGSYANQLLMRLKTVVAKERVSQAEQEQHVLQACEMVVKRFSEQFKEVADVLRLFLDESQKSGFDQELFIDINLQHYPVRALRSICSGLDDIVKNYAVLNKRNRKKDNFHLNKHMMLLVHSWLTLAYILEHDDIVTDRVSERPLLKDIRDGQYMDSDGKVDSAFYEMLEDLKKRVAYGKKHTGLPEKPDMTQANELVIEINRMCIGL